MSLLETISNNFIVLNMSQWKINQCAIVAFEIEVSRKQNELFMEFGSFSFRYFRQPIQVKIV